MDTRGRAPRLPIKADIRKTLCLPGGSTLMVCHLKKELIDDDANSGKRLLSLPHRNSSTPAIIENEQCEVSDELLIDFISSLRRDTAQSKPKALAKDGSSRGHGKLSGNPSICLLPYSQLS